MKGGTETPFALGGNFPTLGC